MANERTSKVDHTYASALVELVDEGVDGATLDTVATEMKGVAALIDDAPDLVRLLSTRTLSVQQRSGTIERIFKGRVSDLVHRFLQVVNAKNRLGDLSGIIRAFLAEVDERRGIVQVDATVAAPLDPAAAERVGTAIGQAIGKNVVLHPEVVPEMIGGLKLRIGDRLIDGSLATQLRLMRDRMVAAGRARSQAD